MALEAPTQKNMALASEGPTQKKKTKITKPEKETVMLWLVQNKKKKNLKKMIGQEEKKKKMIGRELCTI